MLGHARLEGVRPDSRDDRRRRVGPPYSEAIIQSWSRAGRAPSYDEDRLGSSAIRLLTHFDTSEISSPRFPLPQHIHISDPAVPGLVLRVAISGSKAWLFRFKWDGTPTRITLGKFPSLGLAEARQLAIKNREWLDRGIDPRRAVDRFGGERRTARLPAPSTDTCSSAPPDPRDFEKRLAETRKDHVPRPDPEDRSSVLFIAHEYIEKWFKAQGKNSKEACRMLRADVLPRWHWRDGRTITSREVIELLDKVVERGAPVMANNLAQMLGHMFKFAIHRGTLENSPVQLLYRPGGKPRRRKRVLSEEELRSFVVNIVSICRAKKRKHVLMVLLLTMQRRGEPRQSRMDRIRFRQSHMEDPGVTQ